MTPSCASLPPARSPGEEPAAGRPGPPTPTGSVLTGGGRGVRLASGGCLTGSRREEMALDMVDKEEAVKQGMRLGVNVPGQE